MKYDLLIHRNGAPATPYWSANDNAEERGLLARKALAYVRSGEWVESNPAKTFDFGAAKNLFLPIGAKFTGGRWISHTIIDEQGGVPAFVLQGNEIEGMTFECIPHNPGEDAATIGYGGAALLPFASILRRVKLFGTAWCFYTWNNLRHTTALEYCTLTFGRVGIAAMGSGDDLAQSICSYRNTFIGDAALSNDIGATSHNVYGGVLGIVARGGRIESFHDTMTIKGRTSVFPSWTPRACAITDTFVNDSGGQAQPHQATKIVAVGLKSQVTPNGAAPENCLDFDVRDPTVQSNVIISGGTYKKNW